MLFFFFILGILLIEAGIPILEYLVSLILSWIEVAKGKASLKISQLSLEAAKLKKKALEDYEVDIKKNVIGFVLPEDDENDQEDEEDDE